MADEKSLEVDSRDKVTCIEKSDKWLQSREGGWPTKRLTTDQEGVLCEGWREIKSQIRRLASITKFEGERENFIFNTFIVFKPVNRFDNGSDVSGFRSLDNSWSRRIWDIGSLYTHNYSSHVSSVQWKLRKDWLFWNQGKDGCSEVSERLAGFRECWDLVRESEVFVEHETVVAGRIITV